MVVHVIEVPGYFSSKKQHHSTTGYFNKVNTLNIYSHQHRIVCRKLKFGMAISVSGFDPVVLIEEGVPHEQT